MQQMLHRVGIEVDYRRYAPAEYFAAASSGGPVYGGKFDLALFSFTPGSSLSNSYLYGCASRIPAGPNASNYCNPAMEDLQSKLNVEYDPWARRRIAAQIEDLAVHDAAYVFLYHTPYRLIMDPTLQRAPSSLDTPYYDIKDWTFRAQS
jgi:ABC-type transport system substrate-binding protein